MINNETYNYKEFPPGGRGEGYYNPSLIQVFSIKYEIFIPH